MTRISQIGLTGILGALLAMASPLALAIPASGSSGTLSFVDVPFDDNLNGWSFSATVEHDPNFGPLNKFLQISTATEGETFTLSETITIGLGGPNNDVTQVWSDWHEELLLEVPGFEWDPQGASLLVNGNASGVSVNATPSTVDFFFSAQSGDVLTIQKTIVCNAVPITGALSGCIGPIGVQEFPTVPTPEPATLALMGLGLIGLGGAARRRRGGARA